MIIMTENEIEKVVKGALSFRKKWRESLLIKKKDQQKVSHRKNKSQSKNWSKWQKGRR